MTDTYAERAEANPPTRGARLTLAWWGPCTACLASTAHGFLYPDGKCIRHTRQPATPLSKQANASSSSSSSSSSVVAGSVGRPLEDTTTKGRGPQPLDTPKGSFDGSINQHGGGGVQMQHPQWKHRKES